jgi:hypothetical protein
VEELIAARLDPGVFQRRRGFGQAPALHSRLALTFCLPAASSCRLRLRWQVLPGDARHALTEADQSMEYTGLCLCTPLDKDA